MFSYGLKDSKVANKEIVEELLPKYNKYVHCQERLNNLENKKHIKRTNDFYMPKIHKHYRQMLKNYNNISVKWKKIAKTDLHICRKVIQNLAKASLQLPKNSQLISQIIELQKKIAILVKKAEQLRMSVQRKLYKKRNAPGILQSFYNCMFNKPVAHKYHAINQFSLVSRKLGKPKME